MGEFNLSLTKEDLEQLEEFAKKIRKKIIGMAYKAGSKSSHFGGSLSNVEILTLLYAKIMHLNISEPDNQDRDRFILSKGHGCLAFYSCLSEVGLLDEKYLDTFEESGSMLLGHPVINKKIGIEFSNGSLGMGLSLGIGVALGLLKKHIDRHVYVLIGDGECNEGSIWEACMAAKSYELSNLTVILDHNKFQQTGSNKDILKTENLSNIWRGFGWNVLETDGHNLSSLYECFEKKFNNNIPKIIIANTIKGKGFSFSENNNEWHHSVLTEKLYNLALEEL